MSPKLTFTSAVVAAALSLAVVPAGAQGRGDNGRQRGGERATQGGSGPRQNSARQAAPRSSEGRQYSAPQAMPRGSQGRQYSVPQTAPRSSEGRQYSAPQAMPRGSQGRQYSVPQTAPRSSEGRQYSGPQAMPRGNGGRQMEQRAVPRSPSPGPRPDDRRGYASPRGGYGPNYSRPYARPYNFVPYRPFYFSRPYYSFRPRLDIGFGLWLGFSVPYPWSYFGSYRPRVYGYYPDGYYGGYYNGAPGLQYYGGLSFDIQPSDADLYVDGEYVGMVGTFTPYGEPLTLMPGVHRIAIVREGFQTMEWDASIERGQVVPIRGALVPW